MLRRAAITSLFMQSPWGELPAGGRSAHHQWNEAEQCVTYEIYATQAQKAGDAQLAGIYKRAAHLALSSMFRWVRPSGEMQIVKNWVDPAQNHAFRDHYLEIAIDLSRVLFIATANQLGTVHPALLDRTEVITLAGYTQDEKLQIAKQYLVPRQLEENGVKEAQVAFEDAAIKTRLEIEYVKKR